MMRDSDPFLEISFSADVKEYFLFTEIHQPMTDIFILENVINQL